MGDIVFNYQALAENLASRGYIVVGINPTYSSRFVVFSDGKVAYRTPEGNMPEGNPTDAQLNKKGSKLIKTWSEDMTFAIDKLEEMNGDAGSKHLQMSAQKCLYAPYLYVPPTTIFFNPILKIMGIYGTINGERGLQITNSYMAAFFDKYLKNRHSNLLNQKPANYTDVKFQAK